MTRAGFCAALAVSSAGAMLASCDGSNDPNDANDAPAAAISSPAEGLTFSAADAIVFSASANDSTGASLPSGSLSWWVELHHDNHTHSLQLPTPGSAGTVNIPVRGETSDNI